MRHFLIDQNSDHILMAGSKMNGKKITKKVRVEMAI